VIARLDEWGSENVVREVAVALARLFDRGGPLSVSATKELRDVMREAEAASRRGKSLLDELQRRCEARRSLPGETVDVTQG
jgi:hypothetical protein